jgi:hypothetical protein
MTHTNPRPDSDLTHISTRNEQARHIVAGCASALPTLADMWRPLADALSDTQTLCAQLGRVSAELDRTRMENAYLRAAMRATLAAHADGEPDPLWYIRDELSAPQTLAPGSREAE